MWFPNQRSGPHWAAGFPYSRGLPVSSRWDAALAVPHSPARAGWELEASSSSWYPPAPPPLPPLPGEPRVPNWLKTFLWTAQLSPALWSSRNRAASLLPTSWALTPTDRSTNPDPQPCQNWLLAALPQLIPVALERSSNKHYPSICDLFQKKCVRIHRALFQQMFSVPLWYFYNLHLKCISSASSHI